MSQQTIQLEAFNTDLHGARILIHGAFPAGKVPPVMEAIQRLRDPFKKKVLITNTAFSLSRSFPCLYDAVFQARDVQDWQLILTYLTYAPKPSLVVAEEVGVPDALWGKMPRSVTFIHLTTKVPHLSIKPYDAIFFAPIEEIHTSFSEYTYKLLQSIHRSNYTYNEHKEILNELRAAGAGIAWSKMNEPSQGGAIYWYDTVEHSVEDRLTSKQLSEIFAWLSDQFRAT
jgi:hypothetical protein